MKKSFKFWLFIIGVFLGVIIIGYTIYAVGSQSYSSYSDNTLRVVTSFSGIDYGVQSNTYNYFIPNNTQAEWNAFYNKVVSGLLPGMSICTTINGGWSGWSGWSLCSVSCGGGTQTRTRACNNPSPSCGGANCSGSSSESQSCNTQGCYTYSWQTSGWGSCSVVCGSGTQTRSVWCQRSDGATVDDSYCGGGRPAGSQSCNTQACQYNTNGPYLSCSGGNCPSRDANWACDNYGPYGWSSYGDAVCDQTRQCTCLTNRWQSTSTCNYNSFMSGGNNFLDCVYTANIVGQ